MFHETPECRSRKYCGKTRQTTHITYRRLRDITLSPSIDHIHPKTHDLRAVIQTLYAKCQSEMTTFNTLDKSMSTIQHDLFQRELTEDAHIDATDNHTYHRSHRPYQKHKPTHIRQSYRQSKQHAHIVQQNKKFRNVRCWGCGRNHHLRDCPTTTAEAGHRLWEEYRNRSSTNIHNHDSPVKTTHRPIATPQQYQQRNNELPHGNTHAIAPALVAHEIPLRQEKTLNTLACAKLE
jgi:hypothetical protein